MGTEHLNSDNDSENLRKSRRATIYFKPSVHTRLRLAAASSGRSISDIVNDSIKTMLDGSTSQSSPYAEAPVLDDHISETTPAYNDMVRRIDHLESLIKTSRKTEESEPSGKGLGITPSLDSILELISGHATDLRRLGVQSLSLFGSIIRGEAGPDSDIDMLVEFSEPVGYFHIFKLQSYLQNLLNLEVDLTTPSALKPEIAEQVLSEAIYAL